MLHLDQLLPSLLFVLFTFASAFPSLAHNSRFTVTEGRTLMGIKEIADGRNFTFDCSPSGPCLPCSLSEKSDEKYCCSETGYSIRLKCVPSRSASKDVKSRSRSMLENRNLGSNQLHMDVTISSKLQRRLLGEPSKSKSGSDAYITYRSCIPAVIEERMSVLGFEALMLALLMSSGSFIYFR